MWRTLLGLVTAVGVVLAWLEFDRSLLAAFTVYTAVIGSLAPTVARRRVAKWQESRPGLDGPMDQAVRWGLRSAALLTLGNVALLGLLAGFGVGVVVVPALLAAGSPRVLAWCRSAQRQPLQEQGTPLSALDVAAPVSPSAVTDAGGRVPAEMTLSELCRAWRSSYPKLQRCGDLRRRAQLVEIRQQYLDELERRDAAAFVRWLRSGARAASDPAKYLNGADRP